jgi:uncharacterized protein (DUF58 family)
MNLNAIGRYLASADEERELLISRLIIIGVIVFVLTVLVITYIILRNKLITRLTYTREFSEKGSYEGDEIYLYETITNRSFLPFFFIDIEYYIFNELKYDDYEQDRNRTMQYTSSRFRIILPYMRVRRRHTIKLLKRGFYQLDNVTFFYGRKERHVSAPAEVYIYPKMTGIDELPIPSSSMQGDAFSRQWLIKDPFSVSGIREYRFGDPFNSINFKATAKSGRAGFEGIRVNNRDFCSNRNFMVYLNFQTPPEMAMQDKIYERFMERGLSYAAALLREAFTFGYRAGFAANCTLVSGEKFIRFPMTQGVLHYEEILQYMSLVNMAQGISFAALLQNDVLGGLTDSEVFILTNYMNESLDAVVDNFHKFGNNVTVIMLGDLKD